MYEHRRSRRKWQKALDEWENYKHDNKKERDNELLEIYNVESLEETEEEKTKKSKVLKKQRKFE